MQKVLQSPPGVVHVKIDSKTQVTCKVDPKKFDPKKMQEALAKTEWNKSTLVKAR